MKTETRMPEGFTVCRNYSPIFLQVNPRVFLSLIAIDLLSVFFLKNVSWGKRQGLSDSSRSGFFALNYEASLAGYRSSMVVILPVLKASC